MTPSDPGDSELRDPEGHRIRELTPAQADAALPQVTALIRQLQGLRRSVVATGQKLEAATRKLSGGNGYPIAMLKNQVKSLATHQLQLVEAFESALHQLMGLGGVLKDLSEGLVDFYGRRDGELVFLCWKLGEPRVAFWHPLDTGFAGRRPL
jgi:hypothetical protein